MPTWLITLKLHASGDFVIAVVDAITIQEAIEIAENGCEEAHTVWQATRC